MSVIDDVKSKIDIVDFIGQYTTLKKSGRNFKATCPFHNEKTPSFFVFPDQGTWHCFGACSTGGDVFSFLMKRENLDFAEALRRLAVRAGVELVRDVPGEDQDRKRLRDVLMNAAAYYHSLLKTHAAAQIARDYIAKRFLKPETIEQFELGYALDEWHATESYLVGKGFSVRDLENAGLIIARDDGKHYDRFRGRLMFPIRNRTGEVIGFGARTLTGDEPKYLNSPQTTLFDKSGTLYGLDLAKDAIREQKLAIIVEGYMDVIGAHQGGFKNVVASLGTALTEKQLGLLKRLTNRYALALDPDAAGEEATKRGLELARNALDRKTVPVPMGAGLIGFEERLEAELLVIPMPEGQDPDELIHADPQKWIELTTRPEPLVDFYFRVLTQDLDLKTARDKSIAVKRLVPIVREVSDAIQRTHYIQQLARLVQVPEQTIAQEFTQTPARRAASKSQPEPTPEPAVLRAATKLEDYCLALALYAPKLLPRIAFLEDEAFAQSDYRALFGALRDYYESMDEFDRAEFRATLDETLAKLHDRLIDHEKALPSLSDPELGRELEVAAHRLRLQRDTEELAQLQVLLRDPDQDQTVEELKSLQERVIILTKRKMDSQRALSTRTILGRM